jgi:hypothetical protein
LSQEWKLFQDYDWTGVNGIVEKLETGRNVIVFLLWVTLCCPGISVYL